jgi:hypothetical protein
MTEPNHCSAAADGTHPIVLSRSQPSPVRRDRGRATLLADAVDEVKAADDAHVAVIASNTGPDLGWVLTLDEGELLAEGLEEASAGVADSPASGWVDVVGASG